MIEFVFGRDHSSNTEYVLEKIGDALSHGHRAIIIIPEQQALYWDDLCAKHFDKKYSFSIETLSFSRLADSVFRKFGGCARHYISKSEKALLMWCAVKSVQQSLSSLKNPKREDRYIDLLSEAASELKMYGVSSEKLISLADAVDSPTLSAKMRDIALISSAYSSLLHTSFDDPEEVLDHLCSALSENNYFTDAHVFIDSFYTLTPKQKNVVRRIFDLAPSVTVTFPYSPEDRELSHIGFVHSYMQSLARLAAQSGNEVVSTCTDEGGHEEFALIRRSLWDFSAKPFDSPTDRVRFINCADRYDEATLAAARIKELVANGARYSEIACICADFEPLRGITDRVLLRCGIPVFVSQRTSVAFEGALRLILSALSCITFWKREDFIDAAKTRLCSLSPDETDAFEIYTDKWNIRGRKMFSSDTNWDMNPNGYSPRETEWSHQLLALANSAKEKLIPPIEAFAEAFPGTVRSCAEAAYKLLCDFSVYDSLRLEASLLWEKGDFSASQQKAQVFSAVTEALDCMVRVMGDEVVDAPRFASLLRRVSEAYTIGTIPAGIDRVSLGGAESLRGENAKHIIILGAKSGEFPKICKDDGFFNDGEKMLLRAVGIELSPESQSRQREEMFRFSAVAGQARESLTVFIPSDSNDASPSLGALRLMRLFPSCTPEDLTTPEARSALAGREDSSLSPSPLCADGDRVDGKALEGLFPADITLTQSRIETFSSCAFQYYCKYILGLDDGARAEVRPAEVGTFVHSVLENFMRDTECFPVSDAYINEKCQSLTELYRQQLAPKGRDSYVDYLFDRISKSILIFCRSLNEEFAQSKFIPHSFELKVGFSSELPCDPIELNDSSRLFIRGIVDRLDVFRNEGQVFLRVVDYKTGTKTFSLSNALKGNNIQLLIYLFSLCNMPRTCDFYKKLAPNGEELVPAGAVYFSARPGDLQSNAPIQGELAKKCALSGISRTGIVLADPSVVEAMDRDISGRFAPVGINSKGDFTGSVVQDAYDFKDIKNTIFNHLKEVGLDLISGRAGSQPSGTYGNMPCQYCKMMPLCRHANGECNNVSGGDGNE